MAKCLNCGKEVKNKFCNTSCQDSYYARLKRERYFGSPNKCFCCGEKLDWKHRKNKYCSSSCAAKVNNKGTKRNYKKKDSSINQTYIDKTSDEKFIQIVTISKNLIDSVRTFGYKKSNSNIKKKILERSNNLGIEQKIDYKKSIKDCTKAEVFDNHKTWQSARSNIRKDAERTFKRSNKKWECCLCGYNNHIEVAHIKVVSEFANDVFISEINDIHNLVPLCPNHHWEFDHNKLSEVDLDRIKEYSAMDQ